MTTSLTNFFILLGSFLTLGNLSAQQTTLHFQPIFQGKNITLGEPMRDQNGDSLAFHTLRFYLGNFVFFKNGAAVFEEKSHRLLDLENEKSLNLIFKIPQNIGFDSLQFDLGVDSLTNVSGAMGGDLDPTRGMFWAWQSGYINFKMEGFHSKCPARNHEFQFHLGGYLPPFQSVQTVKAGRIPLPSDLQIQLDLTPFFEKTDWANYRGVMSPGAEAVGLSRLLAKKISVHAE